MLNANYISSFAIGQVIKKNDKYWQITKLASPSAGDWFIGVSYMDSFVILCCPVSLSFNDDDLRYIVQEVSITPVTIKVNKPVKNENNDENTKRLPIGKIITYKNEMYEVIDYRIPKVNDYYVYPAFNTMYVYQRRRDDGWPTSYNIVVKIEPYKPGQLIVHNGLVYRVLAYRKGRKGEYMIDSNSPRMVITCETDISFKARWIVEPYVVPIE